mmetsp:Transcript_7680/g.34905  ORF Transcript_7680/g.34905 Transcript_7680/m.34905 type:complete len:313 (+) Transcript_7680:252-1190(+)
MYWSALSSTTTLSALRTSYTLRCLMSVCTTRAMFLVERVTPSGASLVMMYAFSPSATPQDLSAVAIALVFGAAPARESTTIMEDAAAADWMAVAIASRLSFLFILMDQSLGLGPKTTPPPGLSGVRLDPARALPVPFCLKGLRPPPRTSLLVSVDAVPLRAFWRTMTTYLCTRPFATSGLATFTSSVAVPAEAPSKLTLETCAASASTRRGARATARDGGGRGGISVWSGCEAGLDKSGRMWIKARDSPARFPTGRATATRGFARTVHRTRVMRYVETMDATERAARRSRRRRGRVRARERHRVKTRRGKKP